MLKRIITRSVKRKILESEISGVSKSIKRKFKEEICSICMDSVEAVVSLDTCLHEFCLYCICKWLSVHSFCPICKQIPNSILYHIEDDSFLSSLLLDSKFKKVWIKQNFIIEIFSIKKYKLKKLFLIFIEFLKNVNYSVIFQRRILYFCNMKTTLYKNAKIKWEPAQIFIDSNHKVWNWLQIELSLFYSQSFVENCIAKLKSQVTNYETLKTGISLFISEPLFSKLILEMNAFLSYFNSNKTYYKRSCKMIYGRVPGDKFDSIIIENQCVNIVLLAKILVAKILDFECKVNGFDDMMPLFEVSNIHKLLNSIIRRNESEKLKVELDLLNFISLRLERCYVWKRSKNQPKYNNCYKLDENYRFIYLNCLKQQLDDETNQNSIINDLSGLSDSVVENNPIEGCTDITIDLTDD